MRCQDGHGDINRRLSREGGLRMDGDGLQSSALWQSSLLILYTTVRRIGPHYEKKLL